MKVKMYEVEMSKHTAELILYILQNYNTVYLTAGETTAVKNIANVFDQLVNEKRKEAEYVSLRTN